MNNIKKKHWKITKLIIVGIFILINSDFLRAGEIREDWSIVDHGVIAPISEVRGILTTNVEDTPLLVSVLSSRIPGSGSSSSLLVVDLLTGEYYQKSPSDSSLGGPYCLLSTERGTFCYMSNTMFYEFDLKSREYIFSTNKIKGYAMSMVEAYNGKIYVATYPESWLYEYNPKNGDVRRLVRLDFTEKYPSAMSAGKDGWLYIGVGTAKSNLLAYHIESGELRGLTPKDKRSKGRGYTIMESDGSIVGRINTTSPWQVLRGGELGEEYTKPLDKYKSTRSSVYWTNGNNYNLRKIKGFERLHVTKYDLAQREIIVKNGNEEPRTISFDYESNGAAISSMADAGDGRIIGSTAHPNQLWGYDIRNQTVELYGRIPELGGGNLTRLIRYKNQLVSNSYAKGFVYSIDLTRPIDPEAGTGRSDSNPRLIAKTSPQIGRPRAMILHRDGKHGISTGFPGYGYVGGGMLIYDLEKDQPVTLIKSEDLLPGFTISAMVVRSNGDLILGTTVTTPGGGTPAHEKPIVAEFDWNTKKIKERLDIPIQGNYIAGLALTEDRYLHIVTKMPSYYILYDLQNSSVVRQTSLNSYGSPAGVRGDTGFVSLSDGRLFFVMNHSLLEINSKSGKITERVRFPLNIYDVGPVIDNVLYLSAASHLLSVKITERSN